MKRRCFGQEGNSLNCFCIVAVSELNFCVCYSTISSNSLWFTQCTCSIVLRNLLCSLCMSYDYKLCTPELAVVMLRKFYNYLIYKSGHVYSQLHVGACHLALHFFGNWSSFVFNITLISYRHRLWLCKAITFLKFKLIPCCNLILTAFYLGMEHD